VVAFGFLPVSRWLSFPLQVLVALPVLAGYVLGSVGLLAMLVMIGNTLAAPKETRMEANGLICRVRVLDGIPDATAISIERYRSWKPLPLERRISQRIVALGRGAEPTCGDAKRRKSPAGGQ
jgi:hypothetical protein